MILIPVFLSIILVYTVFAVYAERKISGFIQDRYGPMEVGPYGILQTIADLIKLLIKEDIVPQSADRKLFIAAPAIVFSAIFAGYAVLPFAPGLEASRVSVGVFYLLAIISLDVIGLLMAGWGSNNKFSLYGAIRAVAQMISYEVPLSLSVLAVVMTCQSLDLQEISYQQSLWIGDYSKISDANYLFGIQSIGINITEVGGFLTWNIFRNPILMLSFVVFFVASLAECNRAPFDIPEAESELVAGFHTEYTGFRFAILFLGEYAIMLLVSFLASILFLGSWNSPFPNIGFLRLADWTNGYPGTFSGIAWGTFWLISKAFSLIGLQMVIRWTYPRLRVDQLMFLCWKVLTPLALIIILVSGFWRLMMN